MAIIRGFLILMIGHVGTAHAEPPRVATDIAPVYALVSQVMEGVGLPDLVIAQNASPHDYAMRPSEARALSRADLVVWIGPALTPWLGDNLDTLAGDARKIELMQVPGTVTLALRDGAGFDDHSAEDHASEGDAEHGVDAHAWLDPRNAVVWIGAIAAELAQIDPQNADIYLTNAGQAQAELAGLEETIRARLAPLNGTRFVVYHDAYHYFEARFGLEATAAISLSDAVAPTAAQVSNVRATLARTGAKCVLAEPGFNPGLVAAVAAGDDGIRTSVLSSTATADALGPRSYVALLEAMSDGLHACLSPQ